MACSLKNIIRLHALAGCAALALVLPGQAQAAAGTNTLVIAKASDPQNLDPAVTMDNNDWTVVYPLYQRLVTYDVSPDGKGLTSVRGELAQSWRVSDDGLTWVFELADGQKFSDGAAVDAKAVEYSFQRLLRMGQGPAAPFPEGMQVAASGPMQVTFTLPSAFAPFLYTLAIDGAAIVNPAVAQQEGDEGSTWLAAHSAGSGAFMLQSWERGQSLVLTPNPHYGGTPPSLDSVRIEMIPEAAVRRLRLESGDVDIAETLPVDQLETLRAHADVAVQVFPSLSVTYLYLNNARAPLADVHVRRAVSYAIDRPAIVQSILAGSGVLLDGPVPEGLWGKSTDVTTYPFDLSQAQAELTQAAPGARRVSFLYSDRDPLWEPIAIATQAYLAALGLDVSLEKLANATLRDRLQTGDFDIAIGNWDPDFSDPFMFMNYWFDSSLHGLPGNRSFYTNAQVDALLKRAVRSADQAERSQIYAQVQKIVTAEAAYVYLYQKDYRVALRKGVEGFVFNPMLMHIYNLGSIRLAP